MPNQYDIHLVDCTPYGHVQTAIENGMLTMATTRDLPTERFDRELPIPSYLEVPGRYRLPLRIDLTAKIDAPGFYVLLGNGHVNFGTPWSDNRRIDDICEPQRKPAALDNHISMGEFETITLIYDFKEMQILVNDQERHYSQKDKYMKSPLFTEMNREGFALRIASDKRVTLTLQAITITEYETSAGIVHMGELSPVNTGGQRIPEGEKPTFENCIARLPEELHREIVQTDAWLRTLRPLKFKRQIEKHGNKITYVASDYGFSYAIHPSDDLIHHTLQWYIITAGKPDTWHRKADWMEAALRLLAEDDPAFAQRMANNLQDCVGCYKGCLARTVYAFDGKKGSCCHGKMRFGMGARDFDDARRFIEAVNELAKRDTPVEVQMVSQSREAAK